MATTSESDDIQQTSCGLFSWRPLWLQRLLSYKVFLLLYVLIGISQSMTFSYLTVVLSTIEKQFGVNSAEIAWIYSGNEISQICFIVFLPFVGRAKKRPLLMGLASVASGCGMFLISMPYLSGRGQKVINDTGIVSIKNYISSTLSARNRKSSIKYDFDDVFNQYHS